MRGRHLIALFLLLREPALPSPLVRRQTDIGRGEPHVRHIRQHLESGP